MKVRTIESGRVGFLKARVKNPIFPGNIYAYHQPLYSYYGVTVATALNEQFLFSVPRGGQYTPAGGAQIALSMWHTNLIGQGGILPNPDRHLVKYISLHVAEDTLAADAVRFLDDTLIVFFIGDGSTEYWRSHGVKAPSGGGVFGFTSAFVNNGWPDRMNQVPMWGPATPIVNGSDITVEGAEIIEQGENFGVTLNPTLVSRANAAGVYTTAAGAAGGIGINAHVYLDGIRVRAVR
mgnify:FL=1